MLLRLLVPFAIALAVYGAWLGRTRPVLTGDEPCYLVQAYSLVQDGDLDLSNNFRSTDPRGVIRFTGEQAGVPKGCAEDFTGDGVLRTWFNPGLPLLLTPAALLVPRSLPLLRVPMVILAALWAQQMYGLLRDVSSRRGAAELVWGGTLLLLPALGFSNQLYPEVPAALGVTIAARCLLRAGPGWRWPLAAAAAVAPLPWLHLRFAVIAGAITVLAVIAGADSPDRPESPDGPERWSRRLVGGLGTRWFVPLPLLGAVLALCGAYGHLYGSPLPTAPYRGEGAALVGRSALHSYRVGIGLLFDSSSGIVPLNPFLWIGLVGLGLVVKRWRFGGAVLVGAFVGQLFLVNPLGFFGYTLPGRFAIVLIPMLAVGAVLALERSRLMAVLGAGLLGVALVPVAGGWRQYGQLYDIGRPTTPLARRTEAVWPQVEGLPGVDGTAYRASGSARTVGRLVVSPDGTQHAVTSAADGPGLVALGPDIELRSGPYTLAVEASGSGPPTAPAGTITVRAVRSEDVLAQRAFLWAEAGTPAGARTVELSFLAPSDTIRVEIESRGTGELALGLVRATPAGALTPASAPVRRDVPLALLWIGMTGLVAVLLVDRSSSAPLGREQSP